MPLGDIPCHLLEVFRADGSVYLRIWIDGERGCFPLRHESLGPSDNLVVAYESTSIAEMDGVWVPLQGFKWVPPQEEIPPDEVLIDVEVDSAGKPLVGFNRRIDRRIFDYRDRLPTGTLIVGTGGEIIEVLGAESSIEKEPSSQPTIEIGPPMVEQGQELTSVPTQRKTPSDATPAFAAPPMKDRRWLVLGLVALPIAVIIVWALLRRR